MVIFNQNLNKKIQSYLEKEKITTTSEVAKLFDCQRSTARRHLIKLEKNNFLNHIKKGNQILFMKNETNSNKG